jgi:DNA (cytosine-5)-methyltransferase 1
LNVGSLFAGIGGFDLGFQRAGMQATWQVELDPYCRAVLAQHFPDAERFEDVREVGAHNLAPVDVVAAGFPCQDISSIGRGAGMAGERSGLWSEVARIIRELRPRYLVVENVAELRSRGLDRVLADLAACGYDAEWDCIPASAVGAPHQRDRIWLVAYPARDAKARSEAPAGAERERAGTGSAEGRETGEGLAAAGSGWWLAEPPVGRVADGLSTGLDHVDQLAALGNALVPQIAEWLGERIMEWEHGEANRAA